MGRLLKWCLPCKYEELDSDTQHPHTKLDMPTPERQSPEDLGLAELLCQRPSCKTCVKKQSKMMSIWERCKTLTLGLHAHTQTHAQTQTLMDIHAQIHALHEHIHTVFLKKIKERQTSNGSLFVRHTRGELLNPHTKAQSESQKYISKYLQTIVSPRTAAGLAAHSRAIKS